MTDGALSASLEDYLEAIYLIASDNRAARAKEIADRMNVHRSSVTSALRALRDRALVNYTPYSIVTLTEKGRRAGAEIARRHEVLRGFLVNMLAIEPELADSTACEMEHTIPKPVFQRFIEFVDFLDACPRAGAKWLRGFGHYCTRGCDFGDCERCVEACLEDVRERRREQEGSSAESAIAMGALRPGQRMRITQVKGRGDAMAQRLRAMGLTPGAVVEVERVAPLGDPVEVKIRGYHLSLRKEDLAGIRVAPLGTPGPGRDGGVE